MKFWSFDETRDWFALKNIWDFRTNQVRLSDTWSTTGFDLPRTSAEQADLSRTLIAKMDPFGGCVFWLTEWGVWAEDGNPVIVERIRLSYGERASLDQHPTFVLDTDEREHAIALLRLFIMFSWDGYLVSANRKNCLRFWGHESYAEFYANISD